MQARSEATQEEQSEQQELPGAETLRLKAPKLQINTRSRDAEDPAAAGFHVCTEREQPGNRFIPRLSAKHGRTYEFVFHLHYKPAAG